ncbi:ATP-binding cassette domain-containing protein [Sphingomonas japonica]|uniref:ATP-binding cassette subfamily C protein LapB n=1 Tax=Sphingomonas japonica TaxID=511662 RepID=A0ABX0TW38_9SPHN|nr:ATP-binding cassette domain-containing protein [Sphingomonas japonica]NIJ22538.1 ATP-binding cassette subfamily C protein LapB [Sphingomonas japonica]
MSDRLTDLIGELARASGVNLSPHWRDGLGGGVGDDRDALARLCSEIGWAPPEVLDRRPRANALPALMFAQDGGWAIAEQWEGRDLLRVRTEAGVETRAHDDSMRFFRVAFPDAMRGGKPMRASAVFRQALLNRKSAIVTALVATVVVNLIALATSLYSMQVYDRVIPRSGYATLWVLTVGVVVALLLDFLLRTTRALLMDREAQDIDAEVSEFFFARAQAVRLDARSGGVGTMAAQLRGLEQVRSLYSSASLFLLADFPFAIFFLFVIWALGGIIVLVPLVIFPISITLALILSRLIRSGTEAAQVTGNRKNGLLVESFDAAETVKANRGGWYMLSRWNALIEAVQASETPVRKWQAVASSVFQTLQQIGYVGLIAFGAVEVSKGNMTTGGLVAAAIIGGRVNGPLMAQLPGMIVSWGYARSSLKLLDGILAQPQDHPAGGLRPDAIRPAIRFDRVEFAYMGTKETLSIPTLSIAAGEKVGLIGGIGSGKTTLLRMMAGLYAARHGQVTLGGLDMSQVAEDILRQAVGYLPQDVRLVNGTLRDNLLMGLADPGDAAILEAAEKTGLVRLISAHPMGLDLPISEGGRGLSGGQRTLTGITRMLIAQPSLWLLDEPSSNLDQNTETSVMRAVMDRIDEGHTLVLVTHKMSLLSMVDRVIVMGNGRITLDGPTREVIARLQTSGTARVAPAGGQRSIAQTTTEGAA